MPYVELPLISGVYKDETPLSAKPHFTNSQWVRSNRGKMEVMGGFETATNDTVEGICRGLHAWRDNISQSYEAIGTNTYLQVFWDGELYDITPLDTWGQLTNPFTTVASDATVTVADTAHGRSVGDRVIFANATAVGGITPNGEFVVTVVDDVDNYKFEFTSPATGNVSGGGGTVDYEYILPIGLVDNLGGAGYGVGAYGTGGYGQGASEDVFYPRTWSLDNWGQNLVACPRGGKIYEWAPEFTATEIITNGNFASDTAWTKGTGWTIGSGVATGTAGSDSNLQPSTAIALTPGSYYMVEMDLTRSAGEFQVFIGSTAITSALTSSQHVKVLIYYASGNLIINKDASGAGTVDNVSIKPSLRAAPIPNAPAENKVIWVTDQRILVAAGTIEAATGLYNPVHVRWTDQEDSHDWTPTASNQSSFFTLGKGGQITTGMAGRGENALWCDRGLYLMRYVPDPNVVYSFNFVGSGCGPIGSNSTVMLAGQYYWMANTGEFFGFSGGAPVPLFCPVRKYVFDSLAAAQGEKVFAFANSAYKEVGWLYPGASNECDSYVLYNVVDKAWTIGTVDRTAWLDAGGIDYATAISAVGVMYFMERGHSFDGDRLNWSMETAAIDISGGNSLMRVMGIIPDFDDFVGGCTVDVTGKVYPNSTGTTASVVVNDETEYKSFRVTGRQVQFTFTGDAAPAFMRTGAISIDVRNSEQQR